MRLQIKIASSFQCISCIHVHAFVHWIPEVYFCCFISICWLKLEFFVEGKLHIKHLWYPYICKEQKINVYIYVLLWLTRNVSVVNCLTFSLEQGSLTTYCKVLRLPSISIQINKVIVVVVVVIIIIIIIIDILTRIFLSA